MISAVRILNWEAFSFISLSSSNVFILLLSCFERVFENSRTLDFSRSMSSGRFEPKLCKVCSYFSTISIGIGDSAIKSLNQFYHRNYSSFFVNDKPLTADSTRDLISIDVSLLISSPNSRIYEGYKMCSFASS